jgi:hypothetical protein
MIEKTEDEISAECLRVLQQHEATKNVRRVPIVAMAASGTANN